MRGSRRKLCQPATYRIRIQGRLDESWSHWFGEMAITVEKEGDRAVVTTLTGTIADQPALHSILSRIRDLGLLLLQVECLEGKANEEKALSK